MASGEAPFPMAATSHGGVTASPPAAGDAPPRPRSTYRDFSTVPKNTTYEDILRIVSEASASDEGNSSGAFSFEGCGSDDGDGGGLGEQSGAAVRRGSFDSESAASMNTASTGGSSQRKRRGPSQNFMFPTKLHKILSRPDFAHIIAWTDDGRAWKVLDKRLFSAVVMPEYFSQSKYPSFVRQVNGWGYRRISRGKDRGTYYHEMFLRGCDHLVQFMDRTAVCETAAAKKQGEGGNRRSGGVKEADPDFSAFPPLPPLDLNAPVADPGRRYGVGRPSSGSSARGSKGKKKRSRKDGGGGGGGSARETAPTPSSAASSTIPDAQVSGVAATAAAAAAAAGGNSPSSVSSSVRTKSPPENASGGAGIQGRTQNLQSGPLSAASSDTTNNTALGWNTSASSTLPNGSFGCQQQQQQGLEQQFNSRLQQVQGQVATLQTFDSHQDRPQQQLEHYNHLASAPSGGATGTVGAPSNQFAVGSQAVAQQNISALSVGGTGEAAVWGGSSQQQSAMLGASVSSHMQQQRPSHTSGVNFQAQQQIHRSSSSSSMSNFVGSRRPHQPSGEEKEACSSPPRSRPCLTPVGGGGYSQQEEKQSSPTFQGATYPRSIQAQLERLQQQQRQLEAQPSAHMRLEDILAQARLAQEWAQQTAAPAHQVTQPQTYSANVADASMQFQPSQVQQRQQQQQQHLQNSHQVQHHVHWHSSTAMTGPDSGSANVGTGAPLSRLSRAESAGSQDSEDHRGIYEALERFCTSGDGENNEDGWRPPARAADIRDGRGGSGGGGEGKVDDDGLDEVMADADHRGGGDSYGPMMLPFGSNGR